MSASCTHIVLPLSPGYLVRSFYDLDLAAFEFIQANNIFPTAQALQHQTYLDTDVADHEQDLDRFQMEMSAWKASMATFNEQFDAFTSDELEFYDEEC
eukprot:m.265750 g.265750  ORF g.265750 m.265750 type:complete len:98 (+) comp54684_c0_seq11:31-324(+)